MVCPTCVEAAKNKREREAHCNNGNLSNQCDCQHRVPTLKDIAASKMAYVIPDPGKVHP